MKRLTCEGNFCDIAKCETEESWCKGSCSHKKVWDKLKQYEDAEADGRLMVTPCKPENTIYWILEDDGEFHISPDKIIEVGAKGFFVNGGIFGDVAYDFIPWDEIGKTAFLTEKEAQAALAKKKEV